MDRLKSIALIALGIAVALVALGFLASVGFATLGALVILGAATSVVAGIASVFGKLDADTARMI